MLLLHFAQCSLQLQTQSKFCLGIKKAVCLFCFFNLLMKNNLVQHLDKR